jgi:hypothetical protein
VGELLYPTCDEIFKDGPLCRDLREEFLNSVEVEGGNGPLPVVRVGTYLVLLLEFVAGITEIPAADGSTAVDRLSREVLGWGDGDVETTTGGSPIQRIAMPCCMLLFANMLLCCAVYGAVSWKSKQHSRDPSQGSIPEYELFVPEKKDDPPPISLLPPLLIE